MRLHIRDTADATFAPAEPAEARSIKPASGFQYGCELHDKHELAELRW